MKRSELGWGLLFVVGVSACAPEPAKRPDPEADLRFVRPYRADVDECKLVGESPATAEYLDDAADLVACPSDYEGLGVFVTETGGREVATFGNYTLFSVTYR